MSLLKQKKTFFPFRVRGALIWNEQKRRDSPKVAKNIK